jgi:hypothetical protein
MRSLRMITMWCLLLAAAGPSLAEESAADAKLRAELTALEKGSWEASLKDDKQFFMTYLAPESKFFLADGSVIGRDQVIKNLDDFHLTKYTMGKTSLLRVNEDAAMIMYTASYEGVHKGKQESYPEVESSSLYVRRGGKWLEIFYQETVKVAPPTGADLEPKK